MFLQRLILELFNGDGADLALLLSDFYSSQVPLIDKWYN